jgi:hypothetical protein
MITRFPLAELPTHLTPQFNLTPSVTHLRNNWVLFVNEFDLFGDTGQHGTEGGAIGGRADKSVWMPWNKHITYTFTLEQKQYIYISYALLKQTKYTLMLGCVKYTCCIIYYSL